MTGPSLLPRWAGLLALVFAVEAVITLTWLIALTESVATLQLIAGLLVVAIWLPAGILLPVVLRPSLAPLPHRRQICAALGAATGLITGLIPLVVMTAGIALMERLGQSYAYRPSSPWIWPGIGFVLCGVLSAVAGLIVLRRGLAAEGLPPPAEAGTPAGAEPSGSISPDGRWRWDGSRWLPREQRPLYSEDGRWYWEGTRWVPAETPPRS
ncbi:MAG TPA: hypothetical protein VIA06_13430 [Candidatus Dormibacteraeota bacterium]|nr:hypothetical protein [Candidatus Dormibacteraeota bacterium]